MKKILSALLCIGLMAVAYAQPPLNISTGATPWKVLPGNTPALVINPPHFIWQSNVSTPVPGTNAQWINSTGTLSAPVTTYTFEKDIIVPAGTGGLSLNFRVSADDVLQAIELVKPGGSTIISLGVPPIPSASQPYQLRKAIDTTVKCPEPGTWKLRAIVRFLDGTGGFLLSGSTTFTQGNCCNCGKWGTTVVSSTGFNKKVKCGQTVTIKRGTPVTIKPAFYCTGGCEAKYTATLTSPSGKVQHFSGNSFSFTTAELCNYKLTITPICGDKKCTPCTISFFSTIGCPGDVTGGSRFEDLTDVVSLGELHANQFTGNAIGLLEVNANEEMLDIPNGSYKLLKNKNAVHLADARGVNIRTWEEPEGPVEPEFSCQEQEDAQWLSFRQNKYPMLLETANRECRAITYCLTIYCDGNPRVFYLMLIKPTNPKCKKYDAAQYHVAVSVKDLMRE